jgi:cytochrome c biogenesis protein
VNAVLTSLADFAKAKARNGWRQLTSMRTALVLLVLLALAAIPGSVFPQRSVNPEKVTRYFQDHPSLAPVLDKIGGFDVFRSPWFAAIYLLLFTSLIGCLIPRTRDHARALLARVPDAPKRLERLPAHHQGETDRGPQEIAGALRGWRTVIREQPDGSTTISAERGYLKEAGNLVFHTALMGVLAGVAVGSFGGWHANRLLVQGPDQAFCTSVQQFDDYQPGAWVGAGSLPKYCFEMTGFQASYLDNGQPKAFGATVAVSGEKTETSKFSVNHPLRLGDANLYLLGHGYAPVLRYTGRDGKSQTTVAPFLPVNEMTLTSEGVAIFPDADADPSTGKTSAKDQIAFDGVYVPTAPESGPVALSVFPAENNPRIVLTLYRGDLGLDLGIPSSVYKLNQQQIANGKLKQVGEAKALKIGESWTLDDGSKVEFVGTRPWVSVALRHDPGEAIVLVSMVFVVSGLMLSLTGKRRRVWVRLVPSDGGRTVLIAGGLARSDYPGFAEEFAALLNRMGIDRMGGEARESVGALR